MWSLLQLLLAGAQNVLHASLFLLFLCNSFAPSYVCTHACACLRYFGASENFSQRVLARVKSFFKPVLFWREVFWREFFWMRMHIWKPFVSKSCMCARIVTSLNPRPTYKPAYTHTYIHTHRRVIGYYSGEEDAFDMRKALPRDVHKQSIIPLDHPVYPEDLGEP